MYKLSVFVKRDKYRLLATGFVEVKLIKRILCTINSLHRGVAERSEMFEKK